MEDVIAVTSGRQYLVDGSYDYYHYMQDGINDNVRCPPPSHPPSHTKPTTDAVRSHTNR